MKKGFTLVELLAVIVILALVALITIPVILNVVEKSKIKTYQRSIDAYGGAVNKAIAEYILDHEKDLKQYLTYEDIKDYIKYEGNNVECDTFEIYKDKTVYLAECKVNGEAVAYTYGTYQEVVYDPGLYDENYNLIASWDDLVTRYHLDVAKDYTWETYEQKDSGSVYEVLYNNSELQAGKKLIIKENESNNKIGTLAFKGCTWLTSIVISKGVRSIGNYAFSGCTNLTNITIPNSVTSIDQYAFQNCKNLLNVTLPNSLTSIGDGAFSGCAGLTALTIPTGVVSVGNFAFSNCTNLTDITFSSSVINIGHDILSYCSNLSSIKVETGNEKYEDRNSNAIIEKSTNKLIQGCKNTTIPNSVTSIGDAAFRTSGIEKITIPNSVTSIGVEAFLYCSNLKSITISSSVTSIGKSAFSGCISLSSIKVEKGNTIYEDRNSNAIIEKSTNKLIQGCKNTIIPNGILTIGKDSFNSYGTDLESITIPSSVTKIESYAFGIDSLVSIIFENPVGWYTFSTGPNGMTRYDQNFSDPQVAANRLNNSSLEYLRD